MKLPKYPNVGFVFIVNPDFLTQFWGGQWFYEPDEFDIEMHTRHRVEFFDPDVWIRDMLCRGNHIIIPF